MLKDFTKQPFDIIIQAGQSNSDGTGYGCAARPYQVKQTVWYMESPNPEGKKEFDDLVITKACEMVSGNHIQSNYSLAFADCWLNDGLCAEGRALLILRASVGGTGFDDGRWTMDGDLYLRMMEMIRTALSLNPENRLRAFLWHQGENDTNHLTHDEYYAALSALLDSVRTGFDCPELPFVCGDFVHQWEMNNLAVCEPIISAQRDLCANTPNCAFVETDELPSNDETGVQPGDTIHFCRESLYRLGRKYYAAYRDIVG